MTASRASSSGAMPRSAAAATRSATSSSISIVQRVMVLSSPRSAPQDKNSCNRSVGLQPRIDRLALQCEYAEDALVDASVSPYSRLGERRYPAWCSTSVPEAREARPLGRSQRRMGSSAQLLGSARRRALTAACLAKRASNWCRCAGYRHPRLGRGRRGIQRQRVHCRCQIVSLACRRALIGGRLGGGNCRCGARSPRRGRGRAR